MFKIEKFGKIIMCDDEDQAADAIFDDDDVDNDEYDEYLNEVYGDVEICGLKYCASYAFKEVDPIAYNCGLSDWADEYIEDMRYDISRDLSRHVWYDGAEIHMYNATVTYIEDADEGEDDDDDANA